MRMVRTRLHIPSLCYSRSIDLTNRSSATCVQSRVRNGLLIVGRIGAAATAFVLSMACTSAGVAQSNAHITLTVEDQGTQFDIPKSYLSFKPNRVGGEQNIVVLSVLIPDLHPDLSENYSAVIENVIGPDGVPIFREQVTILLLRGRPFVQKLFRRDIERMTHDTGREKFGLNIYRYTRDLPNRSSNGFFKDYVEYLVPSADFNDHGQYFECYLKVLADVCRGWGNYNQNLYYRYYFAKKNLQYWEVLDANARALLDLFERRARLGKFPENGE